MCLENENKARQLSVSSLFWVSELLVLFSSPCCCLRFTQKIFYFVCYKSSPPSASQNQAKLFIEQKKIPFPVDNHNVNEELGKSEALHQSTNPVYTQKIHESVTFFFFFYTAAIGYVLIGNGLFDEAIKHFSLLLQVRIGYLSHWTPFKLAWTCSWKVCVGDAGGPRAGQRHLRARDGLREKKSTGEQSLQVRFKLQTRRRWSSWHILKSHIRVGSDGILGWAPGAPVKPAHHRPQRGLGLSSLRL